MSQHHRRVRCLAEYEAGHCPSTADNLRLVLRQMGVLD